MNTIDLLVEEQQNANQRLALLYNWLTKGETFGLDLSELLRKVESVAKDLKNKKIRIALLGGFSEGKTSVLAAWLEQQTVHMQIAVEESSDAVRIYTLDKQVDIEIVDTPGLFGYKEKALTPDELIKYEEISKKYISESHLVLYVMNPVNPIKESHHQILKWLMRDLDLLSNTIFILNKFDEVADLEEEDEYEEVFSIKRKALIEQLTAILSLTKEEANKILSVGIAANPYNKGVEFWLTHPKLYQELSRLENLKLATRKLIATEEGNLFTNQIERVVFDVVTRYQTVFQDTALHYERKLESQSTSVDELREQLTQSYLALGSKRVALIGELEHFFDSLKIEVNQLSLEDWSEFLEREIGTDGELLNDRLEQIFHKYAVETNAILQKSLDALLKDLSFKGSEIERTLKNWLDKGIILLESTPVSVLEKTINYSKKIIGKGSNTLSKQAVKEAGKEAASSSLGLVRGIQNSMVLLSAAMEIYDIYKKQREKSKFEEAKAKLIAYLRNRKEMLVAAFDNDVSFIKLFYSDYDEVQASLKSLEETYEVLNKLYIDYKQWLEEGDAFLHPKA